MTNWNYRIIRLEEGEDAIFLIGRVYYEEGVPVAYSECSPQGESLTELKADMTMMEQAYFSPVLTEELEKWKN